MASVYICGKLFSFLKIYFDHEFNRLVINGLIEGYSWSSIFMYHSEVFPVQVRARTLGIMSFFCRQMVSFVPFIFTLSEKMNIHFLSIYLFFGILNLVGSIDLPETFVGKKE